MNNCFISLLRIKQCIGISGRKISSRCIVYQTECINPFYNLAFEEWMLENANFTDTSCLFIWRSKPSVVLGRHQNAWLECNLGALQEKNVLLVRRQSGGGAVYHDLGNVNITFISSRTKYDRRSNLRFIVEALTQEWKELNLSINERDDVILNRKYKISGSSSKLGRHSAYHHCTLLYNANLNDIQSCLESKLKGVETKASASVRSMTKNLTEVAPHMTYLQIREVLTKLFFSDHSAEKGVQLVKSEVDPTDDNTFPGVNVIAAKLQSWDWIFGKSPKFTVRQKHQSPIFGKGSFSIDISNGHIKQMTIDSKNLNGIQDLSVLSGTRFILNDIRKKLASLDNDGLMEFLCEALDGTI